jgi:hypothetical protein
MSPDILWHERGAGALSPALPQALRRLPRFFRLLAAALLALSQLSFTLTPGEAVRRELLLAAAEMQSRLLALPSPPVLAAMRGHLRQSASINAERYWPNVAVTFRGLDAAACRDALLHVRRLEGRVVVRLENYREPRDCGDANDMTWRIMP